MPTLTPNLSLVKPAGSELMDVASHLTGNMDLIDAAIGLRPQTLICRCTADTSRTSSTTLLDATGMAVQLAASATYALDGFLYWQANTTADIKFGLVVPSGATGIWSSRAAIAAAAGTGPRVGSVDMGALSLATTLSASGDTEVAGVFASALPTGFVTTTTAGQLKLQFAQNTSNATATILKAGSWLRFTRM